MTDTLTLDNSNNAVFGGDVDVSAGSGITFDSGTNYLDDYEEGEHTATITPNTSGTVTLDSTNDILSYEKIGDFVHVHGRLDVDSVSSPTGFFRISLPFTPADDTGLGERSAASIFVNSTSAANISDFVAELTASAAELNVYLGDGTSVQTDSAQELSASSTITLSVSYQTT